jgi:hypothetical protein
MEQLVDSRTNWVVRETTALIHESPIFMTGPEQIPIHDITRISSLALEIKRPLKI